MRLELSTNLRQIKDPTEWDASNLQSQMNSFINSYNIDKELTLEHQQPRNIKTDHSYHSVEQFMMKSTKKSVNRSTMKNQTIQTNLTGNLFTKNKFGLKKVLKEQKIKAIIKNFVSKIKRNITNATPAEYQPYQREEDSGLAAISGLNIPNWLDLLISFSSIVQILCLFFVYTLSLVFQELIQNNFIKNLQTFSVIFYFLEILMNFSAIRVNNGRKIQNLKEIGLNYIKNKFSVDLVCLVILIIDIFASFDITKFFRLCVVLKIGECFVKMEKIQNFFITNFYNEQYWALVKVFLTNFAFAHILAVLLVAMANLSDTNNWLHKIDANQAPWYEKYVWGYYWGTTTMLTVGFGDLTPANFKEAFCLTLIETFSCILLAYNINCVGTLISNIRSQNIERNKNMKIMRRLAQENNINQQLQFSVCNYINESDKMRKKFQFQTDRQFIKNLPEQLKGQFLKQSNIKVFKNLIFFKNLTEKTLLQLAEQIQVKIAHPQQIVFKGGQLSEFMILRSGKVGYCTKISQSQFHHTVIDQIKVSKNNSPKFLHLNFLTGNNHDKFDIKSLGYSMISILEFDKLLSILKSTACDFENFCQMRDKSKHILDQFQILSCEVCEGKHSKMKCPKLHYIPLTQLIIFRYWQSVKKGHCDRISGQRFSKYRNKCKSKEECHLKRYRKDFQNYEVMIYGKKINQRKQKMKFVEVQSGSLKKTQQMDSNIFLGGSHQNSRLYSVCSQNVGDTAKIQEMLMNFQERFMNMIKQFHKRSNDESQRDIFNEIDEPHNFNYYFPKSNPDNLTYIKLDIYKRRSDHKKESCFTDRKGLINF